MEKEHCDELTTILDSKPHVLERYGIFMIILFLSLSGLIVSYCNHTEYIETEGLVPVKNHEKILFRTILKNYDDVSHLIKSDFILESESDRILCRGVKVEQHSNNIADLFFIPVYVTDTVSLLTLANGQNLKLKVELSRSYFQIIFN